MVFSSSTFLFVFLPIFLLIYYLLQEKLRNPFLLFASLLFYAWGEPTFVFVMMGSIVANWLAAFLIETFREREKARKAVLVLDVAFNLSLLFVFKYLNFTTGNLHRLFSSIPVTNIALPIGISFFTFQAMSYVIDVYRKDVSAEKNILNVGLYISLFPQLIAGPIVRYRTVAEEIRQRSASFDDFSRGVSRFILGLAKKIILANNLAVVADTAYNLPGSELSVCMAWLGSLAYTLQIYFDFSGYSDMAIGLGRMCGFHFDENFNYPYIAANITDFWRRWHISLSSWFRDYVYIPLGGSRAGESKTVRNLFIVWLLTGIWHGASWNFIAWGMTYFVLLMLEKYVIQKRTLPAALRAIQRAVCLFFVNFCWVIFRAPGLRAALSYLGAMFGRAPSFSDANAVFYAREYLVLFLLAILCSTPALRSLWRRFRARCKSWVSGLIYVGGLAALLLLSVSYLVMQAHNPFIYFNF